MSTAVATNTDYPFIFFQEQVSSKLEVYAMFFGWLNEVQHWNGEEIPSIGDFIRHAYYECEVLLVKRAREVGDILGAWGENIRDEVLMLQEQGMSDSDICDYWSKQELEIFSREFQECFVHDLCLLLNQYGIFYLKSEYGIEDVAWNEECDRFLDGYENCPIVEVW